MPPNKKDEKAPNKIVESLLKRRKVRICQSKYTYRGKTDVQNKDKDKDNNTPARNNTRQRLESARRERSARLTSPLRTSTSVGNSHSPSPGLAGPGDTLGSEPQAGNDLGSFGFNEPLLTAEPTRGSQGHVANGFPSIRDGRVPIARRVYLGDSSIPLYYRRDDKYQYSAVYLSGLKKCLDDGTLSREIKWTRLGRQSKATEYISLPVKVKDDHVFLRLAVLRDVGEAGTTGLVNRSGIADVILARDFEDAVAELYEALEDMEDMVDNLEVPIASNGQSNNMVGANFSNGAAASFISHQVDGMDSSSVPNHSEMLPSGGQDPDYGIPISVGVKYYPPRLENNTILGESGGFTVICTPPSQDYSSNPGGPGASDDTVSQLPGDTVFNIDAAYGVSPEQLYMSAGDVTLTTTDGHIFLDDTGTMDYSSGNYFDTEPQPMTYSDQAPYENQYLNG
ncbi:hypothetical protein GGS20DRAFT_447497 [Poronia punctata]|nr:hypothetical protein GGS20DRAFT_447497 [Poronia punctata]